MNGLDLIYADMDAEWKRVREARKAARIARGWKPTEEVESRYGNKDVAAPAMRKGLSRAEAAKEWKKRIKELVAHFDEFGYAYGAAKRWGIKPCAIRIALKRAGIKGSGKLFRRVEHWTCRSRTVEIPEPEEGRPRGWRCAVDCKPCKLAKTCVLGGREGCKAEVANMDVLGFCIHAVREDIDFSDRCTHFHECAKEWRCWRRENVTTVMLDGMWATQREIDRVASANDVTM